MGVAVSRPREPVKPTKSSAAVDARADGPDTADKIALEHWEYVKESRQSADFERFIRDFPSSKLAPLAQMQLGRMASEAWQNLLGSESIPAIEQFVRNFPNDTRAADAKRRLDVLRVRSEEAASWEQIKGSADIAAVRAHISRFPGGANAMAARARLQVLERERDAEEHWRATAGATEPDPFEQFLATYPDGPHAAQARARLDEIHRAREETDWRAVRGERHPAPFLRFLQRHPQGRRATEALQAVAALPRLTEEEAWAEIKDSQLPIAWQAYLTAFPNGRNAKAARTRMRALAGGLARPVPSDQTVASAAADASKAQPKRWKRALLWLLIALVIFMAMSFTGLIFGQMSYQFGAVSVSEGCAGAAIFLTLAAVMLRVAGPRLYPAPAGLNHKRVLLFHAIGAIGILGWMSIVQAVGEASFTTFGSFNTYNVERGLFLLNPALALATLLVVIGSLRAKTWRWPRFIYYGLLLAIGFFSIANYLGYYSGGTVRNYWVTTGVEIYGGAALLFLSGGGLLREFGAWLHRRRAGPEAATG
jgi:hypothetical protein